MIILRKAAPGVSEAALARFLTRARRAAGVRGSVNVLITNSLELRALNRRFRGKDKPTDVLSFPSQFAMPGFAGEIAISLAIAREDAGKLGHAVMDELKILVLHGVLHLGGHDHESDQGEMARLEASLRRKLRLPVGLIERTIDRNRAGKGTRRADRRPPSAGRTRRRAR
jgi:probable rRNA maturation factor